MSIKAFTNDLKLKSSEHNITLKFTNGKYIIVDNCKCYGVFNGWNDYSRGELIVAKNVNKSNFLETLIHESCHMDQWIERSNVWTSTFQTKKVCEIDEKLNEWIEGNIMFKRSDIKRYFNEYIDLELDCEKRAVKKIKKYNLPINCKKYVQKSNAYLLFYRAVVEKYRKYKNVNKEESSYLIKDLVDQMPYRFYSDYSKVSKRVQKVFDSFFKPI